MSKFFEALERAEKERVRRSGEAEPVEARASDPLPGGASELARAQPDTPPLRPPGDPRGGEPRRPTQRTVEAEPQPEVADDLLERVDEHLIGILAPNAVETEQYRTLCQLLRERKQLAELSAIAFSSPAVGDGKTTTAINVAGLLAHDPQTRVLLLEADLRAPTVARQLGLTSNPRRRELADVLSRPGLTLDSLVERYRPLNLDVVTAGKASGHPHDLIASSRFGEILGEARRRFDFVIVDSPPLVPFPDCRIISSWVDAFIVVVAAHRTPRRLLEEGLATIDSSKLLGILFNGAELSLPQYPGSSRDLGENGTGLQPRHKGARPWRLWPSNRGAVEP